MKKIRIIVILSVAVAIFGLIIAGCETTGNAEAPVPGGSGAITISGIGATSLTLTWTKAMDDVTAPEDLEYRAYYATVSSITTPEDVEANAAPVGDWEKDIGTKEVTGLTEGTDYYFAVLVRDEDGNMAVYKVAAVFKVTVTFENIPASAASIGLSISGTNMEQIDKMFSVISSADVWVPAGKSRKFEAVSNTASVTSRGEADVDVLTVDDKAVTLTLSLYETKIIVPDAMNNRIVQIDDMSGNGWTVLDYNDFGFTNSYEFLPYDIDFDSLGRIYIANDYGNGAGTKQILRIDDFNDSTPDTIIENMTKGVVSVAVDRKNENVYYSTDYNSPNTINRCDYDGTNDGVFVNGLYGFYGLAVDEEGSVYAVDDMSDFIFIDKYDSGGNLVDGQSEYTYLSNPLDMLVRGSYVYLLNNGNYEILRLDKSDLSKDPSKKYGTQDNGSLPDNPGEFFGPRRFVAILNKKLTVTDEVAYDYKDRLVSLDDTLDGSGWTPYGENGSGTGQFSFFVMY